MEQALIGTWHIYEMEQWDKDYFNMKVQAFIEFKKDGTGDFQFGLVNTFSPYLKILSSSSFDRRFFSSSFSRR